MAGGLQGVKAYVADTHALFWYLTAGSRLGAQAQSAFDEGTQGLALIYVPAIVLAELYYLNVKAGRPVDFASEMKRLEQSAQYVLLPFSPEDTLDFDADAAVPEMHDRIITGVARRMKAGLTAKKSCQRRMLKSTFWKPSGV